MRLYGLLERLTKLKLFNAKEVSIEPATQAGSSDKVINIPAIADADTPQEMVLSKQSQTLEKKTLTSPNLNGSVAATVPADELNLSTAARTLKIKDESTNVASISTASLTADRIFTLPDVTGTIVTTGDTGSITSAMIANGTIKDEDISSAPADKIAGSKITSTFGAQLLRTDQKLEVYASSPNEAVLINQTGIGNALVVEDATNPDTTATVIDNAGNVGIGVAATDNLSLNGKLTVAGNVKVTSGDINLDTAKGIESHTAGATLNVGTSTNTSVLNLGTGSSTQTVNIGTGAGVTEINIGSAGDTVKVAGTLVYVDTADLRVSDSKIILNRNGALADNTGIELEGGGSIKASILFNETNGSAQPQNTFTLSGTGSLKIPSGTTGEQPASPVNGMIRYNSTNGAFEGYASGAWSAIGGGGTIDKVTQASAGFAVGDVLYLNGSTYTKAIATSATAAEVVGVVSRIVDAAPATFTFEMTLSGEVSGLLAARFDEGTLPAVGEVVFLSPTNAGKLTITEPSVVGQISVPVGVVSGSGALYVQPKRGVVVGGANVRTQIGLANNATTTVQNASGYDAGSLSGWVYIDATTDLRFYVQAQFAKKGAAVTDYDLSYQTTGDTPPAGFSLTITNAGLIQAVMPSIAGFSSAYINFALNAPAVGATLPLQVDSANVSFTDIKAASAAGITFKEDGNTTVGSVSDAGAWSFGPASGFNGTHTVYGSEIKLSKAGSGIGLTIERTGASAQSWVIGQDSSGPGGTNAIYFYDNTGTKYVGGVSTSGAWTLGPSSGLTTSHLFRSHNTATSTPAPTITVQNDVGSAQVYVRGANAASCDSEIYLECPGSNAGGFTYRRSDSRLYAWGQTRLSGPYITSNGTNWTAGSDLRLKDIVEEKVPGLNTVLALNPIKYTRKAIENDSVHLGFIAQEVLPHIPEIVEGSEETMYGINYAEITPVLVKAIQEQQAQIEELKAKLAALEAK